MTSFNSVVHFQDVPALYAILYCVGLSLLFIFLLNIVSSKPRNDPETIMRRMLVAVFVMPVVATLGLWCLASLAADNVVSLPFYEWLGFRLGGLFYGVLSPIILVTVAYSGEFLHRVLLGETVWDAEESITSLLGLRNYIVAPISEEYIFRSCMLPVLLPHFSAGTCMFLAPAMFGLAHFHLMYGDYRRGVSVKLLAVQAVVRFSYTTLFGAFSAFLFLRTGHFLSCILSHAYCNYLGFPNFGEIPENPRKAVILGGHVCGLTGFITLLSYLTEPNAALSQFRPFL